MDRVFRSQEYPNSNDQSGNSREFPRGAVSIIADLRLSAGPKFKVDVLDLSPAGFRVQTANRIALNHVVYLTISGFQPFQARVAWNDKEQYGCQFTRQIHSAVFAHITAAFPKLVAD